MENICSEVVRLGLGAGFLGSAVSYGQPNSLDDVEGWVLGLVSATGSNPFEAVYRRNERRVEDVKIQAR